MANASERPTPTVSSHISRITARSLPHGSTKRGRRRRKKHIFKIAAIGIIVAVLCQLLIRSGREEQAMLTSLAGLIVVLGLIVVQISSLFATIKRLFGF